MGTRVILPGASPAQEHLFLSFFDDDEPPTRAARPRRPAGARPASATTGTRARSARSAGGGDPQQLMVRRAVALGVGALVLILLVVGVKGCLNSRTSNSLKDYNRNVGAIVTDSNDQVSKPLFELLAGGTGTNALDLQQNVNQVRVTADEDVKRAKALDVPGDMKDAQYHVLDVLTLRAAGVQKIADDLPNLTGNDSEAAAGRIAGQMSAFLASDVLYSQRVTPFVQEALAKHDIKDQPIVTSQFLLDIQWLDAAFVRKRLTGKGSGSSSSTPAPGTHGHGLLGVKVGDVTLVPGQTNRATSGANPVFNVKFANQGENDEFDVVISVAITSSGGRPITVQKRIDQTTKGGGEVTVQVPLGRAPPLNTAVNVKVAIAPVRGEVNTTNNSATYTVIFGG